FFPIIGNTYYFHIFLFIQIISHYLYKFSIIIYNTYSYLIQYILTLHIPLLLYVFDNKLIIHLLFIIFFKKFYNRFFFDYFNIYYKNFYVYLNIFLLYN